MFGGLILCRPLYPLSPLVVAVSTISRGRGIEHRTVRAWVLLSPSVPVSRLHYWGRNEHAVCVSLHSRSSSVLGLSTNLPGEDLHARRKVSVCVSSDGGLDFYQGGT